MAENRSGGPDTAPPTNTALLVGAGVLLALPVIALLWVTSYARETPRLGGIPFFFWYQFLWVFLCAAMTYAAHRLVLAARKPGPGTTGHGLGTTGNGPGTTGNGPGTDPASGTEGDR